MMRQVKIIEVIPDVSQQCYITAYVLGINLSSSKLNLCVDLFPGEEIRD